MSVVLSILIILVILGILITAHEFGHFIAAKKSGIRVSEFAIGMGPAIWKRKKGETLYSIRAIPVGGFCNMAEDADPDPADIHAFPNAKRRRRALVLVAGSVMNFLVGFLILLGINLFVPPLDWAFTVPVIAEVRQQSDDSTWKPVLEVGDRVLSLNGNAIYNYQQFLLFLSLAKGNRMDMVVERGDRIITLENMRKTPVDAMAYSEYCDQYPPVLTSLGFTAHSAWRGKMFFGFSYYYSLLEPTLGLRIANSWHDTLNNTRLVWVSLGELFGGGAGIGDLMGPVGMSQVVANQVQNPDTTAGQKTINILNITALIAVNLAVMNLLPIPGLDGSRLLFVGIEGIRRRKLNPKYEGYIHAVGMVLLFGLMIVIFFNDIVRWIFGGGF